MVGDLHKVNLTAPDRVIIVEIYQVRLMLNQTFSNGVLVGLFFRYTDPRVLDSVWYERD